MAEQKKYFWIKLKDTFMTSDAVDFLMSQDGGANYVVLYQMLCLKTANTGGRLERQIGEMIIPYDADKIARDLKYFPKDTIIVALELYKKLGLVYKDEEGCLLITNFSNLVGSESKWAQYKRDETKIEQGKRGLPIVLSKELLQLPDGSTKSYDNKRYGGNAILVYERAECVCEICGVGEYLVIHHCNGYSNELSDLLLVCKKCHAKLENFQNNSKKNPTKYISNSISLSNSISKFPLYEEIQEYAKTRNREDLAKQFYDYYTATNWHDKDGKPVKSWKGKFITWEGRNPKPSPNQKPADKQFMRHSYQPSELTSVFTDLDKVDFGGGARRQS